MLFNSFEFLIFFPAVALLHFLAPPAWRWLFLLAASCVFYMAFVPKYLWVLFTVIALGFATALAIERARTGATRRSLLIVCLAAMLGVLGLFKYFNFFNDTVAEAARLLGWNYGVENLKIILPIGLSFQTFQSIAYVIEVYRGNQKAERHAGIYALFIAFFPYLVSGPIGRPQYLLPQFRERQSFDYDRVTGGLKRMTFGLFKKLVIADSLAPFVDRVFDHPHDFAGYPLVAATVCFAYQLYCDFSGYSDIALGAAQVMGFRLAENFDRPYAARSVPDFWRRWHMSLMGWFRDYVYIPLGGNRVSPSRRSFNLLIAFLLSGLWHGARWTFVVWGGLNGLYVVASSRMASVRRALLDATGLTEGSRLLDTLRVAFTFSLVCISWIFFRANSMEDAFTILGHLFDGFGAGTHKGAFELNGGILLVILFMEYVESVHRGGRIQNLFAGRPLVVRWSLYYAVVMAIVVFGVHSEQRFLYFQF